MKNFTWKKWIINSVLFFIVFFIVTSIWNYFENGKNFSRLFDTKEIIQALIVSIVGGLFYTSVVDKKKK
jgi:cellobiose-specific phosphotransferase system component IIC